MRSSRPSASQAGHMRSTSTRRRWRRPSGRGPRTRWRAEFIREAPVRKPRLRGLGDSNHVSCQVIARRAPALRRAGDGWDAGLATHHAGQRQLLHGRLRGVHGEDARARTGRAQQEPRRSSYGESEHSTYEAKSSRLGSATRSLGVGTSRDPPGEIFGTYCFFSERRSRLRGKDVRTHAFPSPKMKKLGRAARPVYLGLLRLARATQRVGRDEKE